MLYGMTADGMRIAAEPEKEAWCPACQKGLVPKCGDIVIWHWAHKDVSDCDPWWEPESRWHKGWKELVEPEFCEVLVNGHRADIVADDGIVIELQHSAISIEEIQEREAAYDKMVWVFDVRDAYKEGRLRIWEKPHYDGFFWFRPRMSLFYCKKTLYLDVGADGVLEIKEMRYESGGKGWGNLWKRETFVQKYLRLRRRREVVKQQKTPAGPMQMGMF